MPPAYQFGRCVRRRRYSGRELESRNGSRRGRVNCRAFCTPGARSVEETTLSSLVFQNRYDVDGDIDFIPDNDTAAIHRILPANLKVLTIDFSGRYKTRAHFRPLVNSIFPPGRLPLSQLADIQTNRARNTAD